VYPSKQDGDEYYDNDDDGGGEYNSNNCYMLCKSIIWCRSISSVPKIVMCNPKAANGMWHVTLPWKQQ